MKSKKRDKLERAFHSGYKAGIKGRSSINCPYSLAEVRGCWMGGWREGRDDVTSGYLDIESA